MFKLWCLIFLSLKWHFWRLRIVSRINELIGLNTSFFPLQWRIWRRGNEGKENVEICKFRFWQQPELTFSFWQTSESCSLKQFAVYSFWNKSGLCLSILSQRAVHLTMKQWTVVHKMSNMNRSQQCLRVRKASAKQWAANDWWYAWAWNDFPNLFLHFISCHFYVRQKQNVLQFLWSWDRSK